MTQLAAAAPFYLYQNQAAYAADMLSAEEWNATVKMISAFGLDGPMHYGVVDSSGSGNLTQTTVRSIHQHFCFLVCYSSETGSNRWLYICCCE